MDGLPNLCHLPKSTRQFLYTITPRKRCKPDAQVLICIYSSTNRTFYNEPNLGPPNTSDCQPFPSPSHTPGSSPASISENSGWGLGIHSRPEKNGQSIPEINRSYLYPATLADAKLHISTNPPRGLRAKEHLDINFIGKSIQYRRFHYFHSDTVNL